MKPGEERLKQYLRRRARQPANRPQPYDNSWGWWMEQRMARVEAQLKWLLGLGAATLAGEVIRIALATFNLTQP